MKVGDALVAIDHGDRGAMRVDRLNVRLDGSAFSSRKRGDLGNQVAESVLDIHADPFERGSVFGEYWLEIRAYRVTKDDRVGDLHHGGLEVHREQHARGLGDSDLFGDKRRECLDAHDRGVDDACAVNVGKAHGLNALIARAADFDQCKFPLDMRPSFGEVSDFVHGNEAFALRDDLVDHGGRAFGDDCYPACCMVFADIGHSKAVDVIPARGKHAGDPRQRARFIIDGERQHMPFGKFLLDMHYTRAFASSSIVPET